jgi:hypothetical protein
MIIDRLRYRQNWNIGFSNITPEVFIQGKKLGQIQWMKHTYQDRFFADPFILKVTDYDIVVFAEECLFEKPKGCIVELIVDKLTKRLKQRYLLLETDSHLSYPAIIYSEDKVYVYPENGGSGELNLYIYDEMHHKLIKSASILDEAVADSTIVESEGKFYLVATKYPETQEKVFLYVADSFKGSYIQYMDAPFSTSRRFSRPAGNFFKVNGTLYRPAQDCDKYYGAGLSIMKVSSLKDKSLKENYEFGIYAQSFRYNLGMHTINFGDGCCVIDGYGYLYSLIGRIYYSMLITSIKSFVKLIYSSR